MWYFGNPSTQQVREAMRDHRNRLGMIATPAQGNVIEDGFVNIVDNSLFANKYPGNRRFLDMLDKKVKGRGRTLFVVAPDVPGKAVATLERSAPMLAPIRRAGFKVALAAQNGLERLTPPWNDFDVLFLGGSPECAPCSWVRPVRGDAKHCPLCGRRLLEWKVSRAARLLTREAVAHGKPVHMGRVNSMRRLELADDFGCDSADGTFIAQGPDINLPIVLKWLRAVQARRTWRGLFEVPDSRQEVSDAS